MVDDGRFLQGDARDLIAKGQLTEGEWHMMQQDAKSVKANLHNRMLAQLDRELSTAIASQPTDQVLDTDVAAAIAGGLWGAASAFFKTPVATRDAPASKSSFLWETAKEAALKSMETNQRIRAVDYLKLEHHSGDISTCEHVVIAVNGFMTHGMDPSTNWATYCQRKNVACYVVLWEAGNGAEWDDFVDKFQGHFETGREDVIATHFTGNPWNRAKNKAHQVGHILADVLRTHPTITRGRKVTLLGHSLGGAVLYSLLDRLAAQNALSPRTRFDLHRVVSLPVHSCLRTTLALWRPMPFPTYAKTGFSTCTRRRTAS
ncbi:hypothetical protein SPRG_03920 [Saprolegnia parasitica CBS 223.65]|uniref:Uncharacterized protein n=1 Tax=Saprolegnia parasitica (strain CBS 223.65) TaxID=695850 RepID=A0A067CKR7_SAPPC|nr:hypothetical protein SPRG_03920 [Saprolegnia parasitica CBS 223.65]KDO31304.1 hypothetical protein SPRG_03920 [Saprolegnia parasitica CBS 223.65]|eukprot:XP_012197903.1 hypothetical protein SPRG_03920 [Saprolegnia parasitica CBS 223.65]